MLVTIDTHAPFWYTIGDAVLPLQIKGEVVVVIDPGKTNMAVLVGDKLGHIYALLQLSGKGGDVDCSAYCREFKEFLKQYLVNVKVEYAGIEAAISKKGVGFHRSSLVLTEIRAELISLFYDIHGKKPVEINNWTWKFSILPDGMRSQSEKGSMRFLQDFYYMYGSADATDVICMYMYVLKENYAGYAYECKKDDYTIAKFNYSLYPSFILNGQQRNMFKYNPELTLEENAQYMANRSLVTSFAGVLPDSLTEEEKSHSSMPMDEMNADVIWGLVVVRC